MRAEPVQVVGEHVVGAEQTLDAHRGRDVGRGHQHVEVGQRQHEHPEHAVGAVDQRQALLLGQGHRLQPGRRRAPSAAGRDSPAAVADDPLADQRQRTVRQRGEVTRAAETAVLVHDGGDPGVQQPGVREQRLGPDPGPTGGQGGDAAAASARGRPRARPPGRSRRRASGSGCAAAGCGARPGCAGWPAHRNRSRCRSAARGSSASASTIGPGPGDLGERLGGDLDRSVVARHSHDLLGADRADAHRHDDVLGCRGSACASRTGGNGHGSFHALARRRR